MRSTARRSLLTLLSAALVLGAIALIAHGTRAQVPDTTVDLGQLEAMAARQPVSTRWLRTRIAEVVSTLDERCYQPALARRAGLAGELIVRANLGRTGRLTGVAVTRSRGGTLTPALASCVRTAFTRAQLDRTPLPAPERPLDDIGAYAEDGADRGPPDVRAPVRVEFVLVLSAPPAAAEVTPAPQPNPTPSRCGPDRSGCRRTGCPNGMRCDTQVRCVPSSCSCDPTTGRTICTSDCGGGTCVPDRAATPAP